MGTRASVQVFANRDSTHPYCVLYRQFDGYPEGIGVDLLKILNDGDVTLVNGFGLHQNAPEFFNGMGDLAAYTVSKLKGDQIGNVYLYPSDHSPGDAGEVYLYTLWADYNSKVRLRVVYLPSKELLYAGLLSDYDPITPEEDDSAEIDECSDILAQIDEIRRNVEKLL